VGGVQREGCKGQEKEKEMVGHGAGASAGARRRGPPARSMPSACERAVRVGRKQWVLHGSQSQAPPGVRAEAGSHVVTGNTFTIQNSLSLEQFPFSLDCGGFGFSFFFLKKRMHVDVFLCVRASVYMSNSQLAHMVMTKLYFRREKKHIYHTFPKTKS